MNIRALSNDELQALYDLTQSSYYPALLKLVSLAQGDALLKLSECEPKEETLLFRRGAVEGAKEVTNYIKDLKDHLRRKENRQNG